MYEDVILQTVKTRLAADADFVALVGRTQDIEISREGRPNALCKERFCGIFCSSSTNLNPLQMSGTKMQYDIDLVLSRKITFKPKDHDHEYLYGDGSAMPKIERRMVRLMHQNHALRVALKEALGELSAEITRPAIDGGVEYHGPRGGVTFRDADWFYGTAGTPSLDPEGQTRPTAGGGFKLRNPQPEVEREYFGISKPFLFRVRILTSHRDLRIPE